MKISISICPTELEVGSEGHMYDEGALLDAIREFIEARLGTLARITCLQVGHRQGDSWATIDGDEEAGGELLDDFFAARGSDEELFVSQATAGVTARLEEREVEGTGWYVYVNGRDAGGPFETEADALSVWKAGS